MPDWCPSSFHDPASLEAVPSAEMEAAAALVARGEPLTWKGGALEPARQLCDLRKEREAPVKRKHESFEEEREEKRRRCEDEALQSAKSMERGLVLRFDAWRDDEVPASLKWRDLREGLTPYGFCGYVRVKDGHALVQMREEQGVFAVMGCAKEEG
eukprot:g15143.t1